MSERLFVKPARPGLVVRDPVTLKPLAEKGESKPRDNYWRRRLKANDVVECPPPAEPSEAAAVVPPAIPADPEAHE
jgi:hypothetical protein